MPSSAKRGAYYKNRTRKWLEARGWHVADMEIVRWVGNSEKRFPIKRDQWGADLVAMSENFIAFVQVKGGKSATGNFPAARRAFAAVHWPPTQWVRRWVVAWVPRSREPRIVEM